MSKHRRVHTGEDTDYGMDSPFKPQYVLDDNYTANQIQDIMISKHQKNKFSEFRTLNTTKMIVFEPPFNQQTPKVTTMVGHYPAREMKKPIKYLEPKPKPALQPQKENKIQNISIVDNEAAAEVKDLYSLMEKCSEPNKFEMLRHHYIPYKPLKSIQGRLEDAKSNF